MTRRYVTIPRELRPYLPRLYDAIAGHVPGRSPYKTLAEALGSTPSRIQQIVLAQRQADEA